jgi:hypothetical protein
VGAASSRDQLRSRLEAAPTMQKNLFFPDKREFLFNLFNLWMIFTGYSACAFSLFSVTQ